MNLQDQKYRQKSKSISSAEPNYLSQFEMRNPVLKYKTDGKNRAFIDNGYEHQKFKVTQRKS